MSTSVTSTLNCDEIMESLGAYALGILEPDEQREIQRHLESCPNCTAALARLEGVVDSLASIPQPVAPPSALRDRLLAEAKVPTLAVEPPTFAPAPTKSPSTLTIPRWSVWPAAV